VRPLKILQTVHGFLPEFEGGCELYVLGLAEALRHLGHECVVVAGSGVRCSEDRIEREVFRGIPVIRIQRSGSFPESWRRSDSPRVERLLHGLFRELRPDVVHVQHWKRLTRTICRTAAECGIPAVITYQDLWSTCATEFRLLEGSFCEGILFDNRCEGCVDSMPWHEDDETREELRFFQRDLRNEIECAAILTAPARAHRDRVADLHGIPRDRIRVVPLGPIRTLRPRSDPAIPRFPEAPLRIGHWAHMDHCKGTHVLVEAARLIARPERFAIDIWGDFVFREYAAEVRRLAEGLPVRFHGRFELEDLERAPLDVAVVPSVTAESFSYTVDEAIQLGLPLLVSDLGALPERIGGAGASFGAGDAEALARRIEAILERPALLDAYRAALPRTRLTMDDHARALVEIYHEAMRSEVKNRRDASRDRDLLGFRTAQLDRREIGILDLGARSERERVHTWRAESDLSLAREEADRLREEIELRRAEIEALERRLTEIEARKDPPSDRRP